jgi:hypothetical protein
MNYNQNHKISQITSETLIGGVDIASTIMSREHKILEDWN